MDELDNTGVLKAVKILRNLAENFSNNGSKKKLLLEDASEQAVFLHVSLKKIPPLKSIKIIKALLPNSLLKESTETCLLCGDLDKRNKKAEIEPDILHYKDLLKKHDISQITEVMTLRQLRTEYKNYETKRQLVAAYDVFLSDSVISGVLHRFLGKHFYKKRKLPIQIEMKTSNLKQQVEKALSLTVFFLTAHGNSCASEVAHLGMKNKEILQNILAAVKVLGENIPGNWKNILGLYIKTGKSKSIPLYMSFENPNDVRLKKPRQKITVEAEELSTLPNAKVKVYPDGRVFVKRTKESESEDESKDIENSESKPKKKLKEVEEEHNSSFENDCDDEDECQEAIKKRIISNSKKSSLINKKKKNLKDRKFSRKSDSTDECKSGSEDELKDIENTFSEPKKKLKGKISNVSSSSRTKKAKEEDNVFMQNQSDSEDECQDKNEKSIPSNDSSLIKKGKKRKHLKDKELSGKNYSTDECKNGSEDEFEDIENTLSKPKKKLKGKITNVLLSSKTKKSKQEHNSLLQNESDDKDECQDKNKKSIPSNDTSSLKVKKVRKKKLVHGNKTNATESKSNSPENNSIKKASKKKNKAFNESLSTSENLELGNIKIKSKITLNFVKPETNLKPKARADYSFFSSENVKLKKMKQNKDTIKGKQFN